MKAEPYHRTNENEYLCPLNPDGGGYIVFGAVPSASAPPPPPRALSLEPNDGSLSNLHSDIVGRRGSVNNFQGRKGTLNCPKYVFRALSSELVDGF